MVMTNFGSGPEMKKKTAFMFLFTSIEISSQSKQRYECRCFVIFRTNFKIRQDRSLAYVPSCISINNFPTKMCFRGKIVQILDGMIWPCFFLILSSEPLRSGQSVEGRQSTRH